MSSRVARPRYVIVSVGAEGTFELSCRVAGTFLDLYRAETLAERLTDLSYDRAFVVVRIEDPAKVLRQAKAAGL